MSLLRSDPDGLVASEQAEPRLLLSLLWGEGRALSLNDVVKLISYRRRLYALTELALRSLKTGCHPDCDIVGEKYVCLFLLIVALSINFCKARSRPQSGFGLLASEAVRTRAGL